MESCASESLQRCRRAGTATNGLDPALRLELQNSPQRRIRDGCALRPQRNLESLEVTGILETLYRVHLDTRGLLGRTRTP